MKNNIDSEVRRIRQVKKHNFVVGISGGSISSYTRQYTFPGDAMIERIGFYAIPFKTTCVGDACSPNKLVSPYVMDDSTSLKVSIKNIDRVIINMITSYAVAILYNKIELNSVFSDADMTNTRIFKLQSTLKDFVGHKLSRPMLLKKGDIIEIEVGQFADAMFYELILSGQWAPVKNRRLEYLRTQEMGTGDLGNNVVLDIPKYTQITQLAFFPTNPGIIYPYSISVPIAGDTGSGFIEDLTYVADSNFTLRWARGSSNISLMSIGALMGYQLSGYTYNPDVFLEPGANLLSNLTASARYTAADPIQGYVDFFEYHFPGAKFDEEL